MVSLFSLSPLSSLLFLLSFTTPQNFTFLPPIVNSARIWRLGIARVATLAQCAFKVFALGGVSYIPPFQCAVVPYQRLLTTAIKNGVVVESEERALRGRHNSTQK